VAPVGCCGSTYSTYLSHEHKRELITKPVEGHIDCVLSLFGVLHNGEQRIYDLSEQSVARGYERKCERGEQSSFVFGGANDDIHVGVIFVLLRFMLR